MNVEPSLANLSEGSLYYFFKATDPTLLTGVEFDLSNA
jgi:hypothetical protein